jgi:uncharacterized protein YbjT (DUF2867 family)
MVVDAEEKPMTLPPILVTGGTGTLGRQVVARLRDAGREVRVLSRRAGASQDGVTGDLATGEGLPAAVDHVGTIVHCASNRKGDAQATRNLIQAATQAGESQAHLVYISIVGVDRFPRGYFKAKLEAERLVADSGLPWTTLRATQFYELLAKGATRLAKLPVIPVPAGFVVQPVDSGEVATRLAELAQGEPSGRVPDMAGPQILGFADLIRTYLRVTGRRPRPVVPVWTPGIGPIRAGALYPPPGTQATLGQRTWPDFLAALGEATTVALSAPPGPVDARLPVPQAHAPGGRAERAGGRRIPGRQGQHVPDVPPRVVVGEDGAAQPLGGAAPGAVGAQHPGGGEDRVLWVVRAEPGRAVGPHRIFAERRGLELHRSLGALAVLAVVHAARVRAAVVRFDRPDRGQHLPMQPRAGPRGRHVPRQIARRDRGQPGHLRPRRQPRGRRPEQRQGRGQHQHGRGHPQRRRPPTATEHLAFMHSFHTV